MGVRVGLVHRGQGSGIEPHRRRRGPGPDHIIGSNSGSSKNPSRLATLKNPSSSFSSQSFWASIKSGIGTEAGPAHRLPITLPLALTTWTLKNCPALILYRRPE